MAEQLIESKTFIPRRRSAFVPRQRLIERLNRGLEAKLILVSASPGFGKTTLLSDWLADLRGEIAAAWLSLDRTDNSTTTFWVYVAAALKTISPGLGERTTALLQASSTQPAEAIVAALLNEVGTLERHFVLVLDDYHLIDAEPIHEGIAFLIDHMPPQMHLVIATRADPPLPLARMRGSGELTEIRAADLRFTAGEATAFLNQAMNLVLSKHEVEILGARTEGWIAGLQLAALSIQGREDVQGFIAAFTGDDRYIVDYLVEEVLARQTDELRKFLLETSILDRMTGPLCDAVTGGKNGRVTLEALDRSNLFVVSLDDKRQWYRYHHLFADVLQAHLIDEHREEVAALHLRASAWYEANDEKAAAVKHALSGMDFERAADLVEAAMPRLVRGRQEATVRAWLDALPHELVRVRPVLCVGYAGVLLQSGEVEAVEAWLDDAEKGLRMTAGQIDDHRHAPVFVDEDVYRRMPAAIAMYRAGSSLVRGRLPDTIRYAQEALDQVAEDPHLGGGAAALLGLAAWASGDLERAQRVFADGIARVKLAGFIPDAISGSIAIAQMCTTLGRLNEAFSTLERSLRLASEQGEPPPLGTADLHVGLSTLHRERNDLGAASQHLFISTELGGAATLPENRYRWFVAMAELESSKGNLDGAHSMLDEAARLYRDGFNPNVHPIPAVRARLWIAQGEIAKALGWASQQGLTVNDALDYLHEFDHITLARLLLAQFERTGDPHFIDDAARLLLLLLRAAEDGRRMGSAIEILALQALVYQARDELAAAHLTLERALALAEPEGYVRIFVDEGKPMLELLRQHSVTGASTSYLTNLIEALSEHAEAVASPELAMAVGLAEHLTTRELEILRLIQDGLRNQEIADHLVISPSTVKRHIANAYGKLGATHRTDALRRAQELKLLP